MFATEFLSKTVMKQNDKKTYIQVMRSLHRYIGFFVVGLTIIFGLSGIVLVYRDTDFLKREVTIERELEKNLEAAELGNILRIRGFTVLKSDGDILYFQNGYYNQATGIVKYSLKELPEFLRKLNSFHKTASKQAIHLVAVAYGISLIFLAISSGS